MPKAQRRLYLKNSIIIIPNMRDNMASDIYDTASTNLLQRMHHIRDLLEEEEWDDNTTRMHETLVCLRNRLNASPCPLFLLSSSHLHWLVGND